MTSLLPEIDPDGLLEYSVVFTDRSLNHMSQSFQGVMREISTTLKRLRVPLTSKASLRGAWHQCHKVSLAYSLRPLKKI